MNVAPRRLVANLIPKDLLAGNEQFEKSFERQQLHRMRRRAGRVELDHRTLYRFAHKCPHHHSRHALVRVWMHALSLIHISEPTRQAEISYAVFCLKKTK